MAPKNYKFRSKEKTEEEKLKLVISYLELKDASGCHTSSKCLERRNCIAMLIKIEISWRCLKYTT